MAWYLGRRWTKRDLLSYVGQASQIAGIRSSVFNDGKADGVRCLDVKTGSGLEFTVLPGRGMDVSAASYRGRSLCWISPTGVTAPAYYEEPGNGWLRSFLGGLLTTCGLTNSGASSQDRGQAFGLHGRVSNASAEDVSLEQGWDGDEYRMKVRGTVREASVFGEHLVLRRSVSTQLGSNVLLLEDEVENLGFEAQPLMLLYHFNFGFPLLGPKTEVLLPPHTSEARDEASRSGNGLATSLSIPAPTAGCQEKVFFHELEADAQGDTWAGLWNPDVGDGTPLGLVLRWSKEQLPCFTQWTMAGEGTYVLGLEPGVVPPLGRGPLREAGRLPELGPFEKRMFRLQLEVLENEEDCHRIESRSTP